MTNAFSTTECAPSTPWSRTPRAIADIMARAAVGVFEAHCPADCAASAGCSPSANCAASETLSSIPVGIPLADESLAAAVRDLPQPRVAPHPSAEHADADAEESSASDGFQPSCTQHAELEVTQECARPLPIVLLHRAGVENAMMHVRKTLREAEEESPSKVRDASEAPASPKAPDLWHMLSDALHNRKSPDEAALHAAEALMDPACGVAALLLLVRMSYGAIGKDLRAYLLERNLVDAVIEMDAEALRAHTNGGNVIWILRANRAESENVLLAQLSGDGFAAFDGAPKFYDSLNQPATPPPASEAILDLCINHSEIPLVSTLVSREQILADRECNLRFAAYADSVDLRKSLSQESDAWQAARVAMQSRARELEERIQTFRAALDALA